MSIRDHIIQWARQNEPVSVNEIAEHVQRLFDRQAAAAKQGMNAAKEHGAHMEAEAKRLHAECNPEALESERAANAQLTEELEAARRIADREATGFRALCEAFERLEEIVGLDTGGGMGPGPALNAVERIMAERDALASRLKQVRRPDNCRNELQAQGKSYPRSGCAVCGNGGLAGCPYETHGAALAKRKDS